MTVHLRAMLAIGLLLAPVAVLAQPVADAGPVTVQPDTDESLQSSAAVVVVNDLRRQGGLGGKLFGTAGGDPAMNGLYTYLAFYVTPGDGWQVFRIGDFLSYRIVSEGRGRLVLEVHESIMNEASGEIGSRRRRIAVSWTPGPDGAPPTSVRVATAR